MWYCLSAAGSHGLGSWWEQREHAFELVLLLSPCVLF